MAGSQTARGGRYWSKRVAVLLLYGSCPLASSENLPQDPPQPLQRHIAILERQRIETQIEASMHADVTPSVALLTRAPGRCGMRVCMRVDKGDKYSLIERRPGKLIDID